MAIPFGTTGSPPSEPPLMCGVPSFRLLPMKGMTGEQWVKRWLATISLPAASAFRAYPTS